MAAPRRWTRDELLLVLHLYERLPFGQQDARNAQVVALAERLGRTPGSVAMKLNNLTSLDPEEKARGIKGLVGASELDQATWDEFHASPDVVEEAEHLWQGTTSTLAPQPDEPAMPPAWQGPTDAEASRRVRLAQGYFRRVVLANFAGRCALTGIATPELLTASHIVAWSDAPEHRVNPANGLCLNRLHDGAFDRYLITFDQARRMVVGRRLRDELPKETLASAFLAYEGTSLRAPEKHEIAPGLLERHRDEFGLRNAA